MVLLRCYPIKISPCGWLPYPPKPLQHINISRPLPLFLVTNLGTPPPPPSPPNKKKAPVTSTTPTTFFFPGRPEGLLGLLRTSRCGVSLKQNLAFCPSTHWFLTDGSPYRNGRTDPCFLFSGNRLAIAELEFWFAAR